MERERKKEKERERDRKSKKENTKCHLLERGFDNAAGSKLNKKKEEIERKREKETERARKRTQSVICLKEAAGSM
jgi:hypothetical protein